MQMCPDCNKVYDESEYTCCPYCSGILGSYYSGKKVKDCPECGCIMIWDDYWICSNCDTTIESDEDDYDGIVDD